MKKNIFSLFFSFSLMFANYGVQPAEDLDLVDFFLLVNEIQNINDKFINVQKNQEINGSDISKNFSGISKKKNDLIKQIPNILINEKYVSRKTSEAYKSEEKNLANKIKINQKNGLEAVVLRDKISLDILRSDAKFDETIISIEKMINDSSGEEKIKQSIEEAILSIKNIDISSYEEFLENKENYNKNTSTMLEAKINFDKLNANIQTYIEILDYLHQNSSFLQPKYLISSLEIKNILSFINKKIPFNFFGINFGKFIFILFIFIFFLSLRKFIARLFLVVLRALFKKVIQDDNAEKTIIKTINKPIVAILCAYGIDLCTIIAYYPLHQPIKLENTFSVTYVAIIAWLFISILEGYGTLFISSLTKKNGEIFRREVINLVLKIIYFIIIIIATLLILAKMGFNVSALIASLGIGGLAVALAAKDILANFFASVMLLFDNSFSQGDWIKCGDVEGAVVEIGLRRTTIRTFDNAMLFVPNSKLANESIRNWNRRKVGRRIKMHIGITYDAPKDKLELCVKDIREMLLSHPLISNPKDTSLGLNNSREVFRKDIVSIDDLAGYKRTLMVYLDAFSPSSIDILIYCFTKTTAWADWLKVKEDVMLKIMDIVKKHNLSFAFPSQSIYIEKTPKDMPHVLPLDKKSIV